MHCKTLPICPEDSNDYGSYDIADQAARNDLILGLDCRTLPPCPDGSDWIPGVECKELPPCPNNSDNVDYDYGEGPGKTWKKGPVPYPEVFEVGLEVGGIGKSSIF